MNNGMGSSWQSAVASWHSFCDSAITFTPTTPLVSMPTTTWTPQGCLDVNNACESAKASVDACSPYISDVTRFSSCTCQPNILTLDYSCFYRGNISCYGNAATLSNMFDYSWCDNFQSVIGTGLVSRYFLFAVN